MYAYGDDGMGNTGALTRNTTLRQPMSPTTQAAAPSTSTSGATPITPLASQPTTTQFPNGASVTTGGNSQATSPPGYTGAGAQFPTGLTTPAQKEGLNGGAGVKTPDTTAAAPTIPPPAGTGSGVSSTSTGTGSGLSNLGALTAPTNPPVATEGPGQASVPSIAAPSANSPYNPSTSQAAPTTTQFGAGNDLRFTEIAPGATPRLQATQGMVDNAASQLGSVDRYNLAQQQFNTYSDATDPAFQAAIRSATQAAAANGSIGSGMLNTDYGDLALNRSRDLQTERDTLFQTALSGSIQDQLNNVNALSGLEGQQFNEGTSNANALRDERSYQQSVATTGASQQAANTGALTAAGNANTPTSALNQYSGVVGQQGATGAAAAAGTTQAGAQNAAYQQWLASQQSPGSTIASGNGATAAAPGQSYVDANGNFIPPNQPTYVPPDPYEGEY